MGSHIPVPTYIFIDGIKECVCSACNVKVAFVQDENKSMVIGLACGRCKTFWPLMLPEEE